MADIDLTAEIDASRFEAECERLRLASPVFGAYAGGGKGGGGAAPAAAAPGSSRSATLSKANKASATSIATRTNPAGGGTGNFENSKHPRGPGGKFIEKGDSGAAVETVQKALGVKADGEFGNTTTQRLREFQRKNGLQVDGVVGQQTAAALLGNSKADEITPGALRPGQYSKLVSLVKKKK